MQQTAHVIVDAYKVLVLVRSRRHGCSLKLRESGKDGSYLQSESYHLENDEVGREQFKKLLNGETINL